MHATAQGCRLQAWLTAASPDMGRNLCAGALPEVCQLPVQLQAVHAQVLAQLDGLWRAVVGAGGRYEEQPRFEVCHPSCLQGHTDTFVR